MGFRERNVLDVRDQGTTIKLLSASLFPRCSRYSGFSYFLNYSVNGYKMRTFFESNKSNSNRGSVQLEFAVAAIFLLIASSGLVDISRAIDFYITLQRVAYEGV